jgi:hypothetical protein
MVDPHSLVFTEKASLQCRQFVMGAPLGIAETLGSVKRLRIAGEADRVSGKPMVEGGDRYRMILTIVVGEQ